MRAAAPEAERYPPHRECGSTSLGGTRRRAVLLRRSRPKLNVPPCTPAFDTTRTAGAMAQVAASLEEVSADRGLEGLLARQETPALRP